MRDVIIFTSTCRAFRRGEYIGDRLYTSPHRISAIFARSSIVKELESIDMTNVTGRVRVDHTYACRRIIVNGDGRTVIGANRSIQTIIVGDGDHVQDVYTSVLCMPSLRSISLPHHIETGKYAFPMLILAVSTMPIMILLGVFAALARVDGSEYYYLFIIGLIHPAILMIIFTIVAIWGYASEHRHRQVVSVVV